MSVTCYGHSSPNVVVLPDYGPCNPQADSISLCCEIGDTCLTNGLCVTQSGVYYNGGCTESTYTAAICPKFCTSGDANWVIECHSFPGAAVNYGDFCCSVNGMTRTCCNNPKNGLGLDAAASSAQAVSATSDPATFLAGSLPSSVNSDATSSSSGGSLSSPSLPTDSHPSDSSDKGHQDTISMIIITVTVPVGSLMFSFLLWRCRNRWTPWFEPCFKPRTDSPTRTDGLELDDRQQVRDQPDPQPERLPRAELEGSQGGAEADDDSVTLVEADANPIDHGNTIRPPVYASITSELRIAPNVASDNDPAREPRGRPVFRPWHDPNFGNL